MLAQASNSSRRGTTSNKKPGPFGKAGRGVSTLTSEKLFATEAFTAAQETPVLGEEGPAPAGSMTCGGQSRKDASVPTTLLSTKKKTTIATWNVRTMYEAGKAAQVSAEMRRYNIALLGLGETRWLQAGQKRLASGELLLYSGHEEENAAHTEGVAIMLSRTAQKALKGWEAHGSRIIATSFATKKKNIKMNVIQRYIRAHQRP